MQPGTTVRHWLYALPKFPVAAAHVGSLRMVLQEHGGMLQIFEHATEGPVVFGNKAELCVCHHLSRFDV